MRLFGMTAVLPFSTPCTRRVLIRVIEGFELAQLGPALMASPCVLLNSLALQGRRELQLMKLESANYLSKRRASVNHPGEGACKEKKGATCGGGTHMFAHTYVCFPFLTWSF